MSSSAELPAVGRARGSANWLSRLPWVLALSVCVLAVLASCTALLGVHRPWVLLPLAVPAVLGTVVVVARLELTRRAGDAPAALALLVVLGAWVAWNLPLVSELLVVGRDASVFTLAAYWLRDNPSSVVDLAGGFGNSEGFSQGPPGVLYTQNTHVVPAAAGAVGWLAGPGGLLGTNLLVGAAAACAVFVAARLVSGPWPALTVAVALLLGLPFLAFSRGLYTEPLTMLFTWLGVALVLALLRSGAGPGWWWLLAGAVLGGAGAVRLDGVLALAGVVPVLGLHLATVDDGRGAPPAAVPTVAVVLLGAAPLVGLGLLDLGLTSPGYLADLRPQALLVLSATLLAAVLAVSLTLLLRGADARRRARAAMRVAAPWSGSLVGLAVLLALLSPFFRVGRWIEAGGSYAASVANQQASQGLEVDGRQTYDEYLWWWPAWYHGWLVVALAAVAIVVLTRRWLSGQDPVFLVVAAALPSLLVYTARASITPDQIWAARRLLPVILPAMLVLTAWHLGRLRARGSASRSVLACALGAAVVLPPVALLDPVAAVVEDGGTRAAVEELCDLTEGAQAVVVVGARSVAGTVRTVCGRRTGVVPRPDSRPEDLLAALHLMDADSGLVVSTQGGAVPWRSGEVPPARVDASRTVWSRELLGAPRTSETVPVRFWVGRVQEDGVVPLG